MCTNFVENFLHDIFTVTSQSIPNNSWKVVSWVVALSGSPHIDSNSFVSERVEPWSSTKEVDWWQACASLAKVVLDFKNVMELRDLSTPRKLNCGFISMIYKKPACIPFNPAVGAQLLFP